MTETWCSSGIVMPRPVRGRGRIIGWIADRHRLRAQRIAAVFLTLPEQWHCENDLRHRSGLRTRALLSRTADAVDRGRPHNGWPVTSFEIRPSRNWFRLTPAGRVALRELAREAPWQHADAGRRTPASDRSHERTGEPQPSRTIQRMVLGRMLNHHRGGCCGVGSVRPNSLSLRAAGGMLG